MNHTPPGWVPDLGLDAKSVAAMTPDEAKEYLTLLIRYFPPLELPSLKWLRHAAAADRGRGAKVTGQIRSGPTSSQSKNTERNAVNPLLFNALRHAPVKFDPPTDQPSGQELNQNVVTRAQATRIATDHLGQVPEFVGAKVGQVVAWDEIDWRLPSPCPLPPDVEDCWVAYLEFPHERLVLRSSRIIIISRRSGAVLLAGEADDEG